MGLRIIQGYFFLFLKENVYCDPSLELSLRDGSNDGSQNMVVWKILPVILKLSLSPLLIWNIEK